MDSVGHNKTNHPMSNNSHPWVTENKVRHCLKYKSGVNISYKKFYERLYENCIERL